MSAHNSLVLLAILGGGSGAPDARAGPCASRIRSFSSSGGPRARLRAWHPPRRSAAGGSCSSRSCRRSSIPPPSSRRSATLKRNVRPLSLLAVALVFVTMAPPSPRSPTRRSRDSRGRFCFVLRRARRANRRGPPPPRSASRLGIPRRIALLIEGREASSTNATALVGVRLRRHSGRHRHVLVLARGTWRFGRRTSRAAIAIGLAVGFVLRQIRRRLKPLPDRGSRSRSSPATSRILPAAGRRRLRRPPRRRDGQASTSAGTRPSSRTVGERASRAMRSGTSSASS